jgi:hypothetical protein
LRIVCATKVIFLASQWLRLTLRYKRSEQIQKLVKIC